MGNFKTSRTEQEKADALLKSWTDDVSKLPFSFKLGGKSFHGLDGFAVERNGNSISAVRDNLQITMDIKRFEGYAAFEWVLHFKNIGNENTEVISELNAADLNFYENNPVLHHFIGDDYQNVQAYKPEETSLRTGQKLEFQPTGGRPTNFRMPYYRMEFKDFGLFMTVGWSGQWKAVFDAIGRVDYTGGETRSQLHVTAGQAEFDAFLQPGEEIRTPIMSFLYYEPQELRAVNLWRRWFIDCNLRKPNGKLFAPALFVSGSWMYSEMGKSNEENQKEVINFYTDGGVPVTGLWMDAGWYFGNPGETLNDWGWQTGTWEVDTKRFPTKLKSVSDEAANKNMYTMLWFEPERVQDGTTLAGKPEWLLTKEGYGTSIVDFGNPDLRKWLTERVSTVLTEGGIGIYRQDFNTDPLPLWQNNDVEGRRGITENHYVQGYLAYWDSLIERFPNMMIDSCASGGRRNDLETARRSVPLHRSDSIYSDHDKKQAMSLAVPQLLPYFGTMTNDSFHMNYDRYAVLSSISPSTCILFDIHKLAPEELAELADIMQFRERIAHCFFYDFYPLTDWSNNDCSWIAWLYFDSEKQEGLLMAYRRENCAQDSLEVKLPMAGEYLFNNLGQKTDVSIDGGYKIALNKRDAAIIHITKR